MSKYWDKINLDTIQNIRLRSRIASEVHEDYIEGLILQAALMESLLRIAITVKVGRKRTHKKFWDGDAKFSQLIIYYDLLGGDRRIIRKLEQYNLIRNKLVHHPLRYASMSNLVEDAKLAYELGRGLSKKLLRAAGFKIPRNIDAPLKFKRVWVDL